MKERRQRYFLTAKVLFLSWILQILFALWVFVLFVIFAKMNSGLEEIAQISAPNEKNATEVSAVLPVKLIAPEPQR